MISKTAAPVNSDDKVDVALSVDPIFEMRIAAGANDTKDADTISKNETHWTTTRDLLVSCIVLVDCSKDSFSDTSRLVAVVVAQVLRQIL